ncbi:MAG: hypothetical protein H7Z14_17745 [Anaerolineae bacterium]|nr:hypothetical protein [Phycisphaerae bacterium]
MSDPFVLNVQAAAETNRERAMTMSRLFLENVNEMLVAQHWIPFRAKARRADGTD